jgi:hypothetical protein
VAALLNDNVRYEILKSMIMKSLAIRFTEMFVCSDNFR